MPQRNRADDVAVRFGQALRARRNARGETLETVAGRLPTMDPKYLGQIERGWHSPTISTAKRLADALETPLAELVRGL